MRPVALAALTLLLGGSLVGCGLGNGGSDTPAVCGSVDTLKTSLEDLKDLDVTSSGAITDLTSGLTSIQGDLDDVITDAKSEFSSQIDAAEKSYEALKSSVGAAKADPSVATLAAVASALSAFGTDVDQFVTDVKATC